MHAQHAAAAAAAAQGGAQARPCRAPAPSLLPSKPGVSKWKKSMWRRVRGWRRICGGVHVPAGRGRGRREAGGVLRALARAVEQGGRQARGAATESIDRAQLLRLRRPCRPASTPRARARLWSFNAVRWRRAPQVAIGQQVPWEAPDLAPVKDLLPAAQRSRGEGGSCRGRSCRRGRGRRARWVQRQGTGHWRIMPSRPAAPELPRLEIGATVQVDAVTNQRALNFP